ncbi:MerR family transcriptional regulator [Clostridium cellulovorans]|uniref:Transcriptional regulator, MerR family n=1 Tax=Clostridium cellulovorans (strain ATCC 35296 / DSM 3052 / OCM 3 / 743B) TaxID=573061 RepID=D9SX59_CLOC7|nr:MerR family transcriptional regulator [Clostridium cellulovorans]ADL53362.1 transcriptional regulator, MerR family [Clostridium cellulovorans 743B]
MAYTIKQAAELTNLTPSTLRYYDKEGLIPILKRTPSGIRIFDDIDISWISLICCLKNSGMPIEEIKSFMALCLQGKNACEDRKKVLEKHKESIERQIQTLEHSLNTINYKIDNYKEIGIFHIDGH